jgi:hypothetical protein
MGLRCDGNRGRHHSLLFVYDTTVEARLLLMTKSFKS